MTQIVTPDAHALKLSVLKEVYCLVTARAVSSATLAKYMGFVSVDALQAYAKRNGITQDKAAGVARLKELAELGLEPMDYIRGLVQAATIPDEITATEDVVTKVSDRTITLTMAEHLALARDYSEQWGNGVNALTLAQRHGMTLAEFATYRRVHGITRTGLPIPKAALKDMDLEQVPLPDPMVKAEQVLERRLRSAQAAAATKWHMSQLEKQKTNYAIAQYTPPTQVAKIKFDIDKKLPVKKLIVNMSDWQIGALAQGSELITGGDWNTELAIKAIQNYMTSIAEHIAMSKCQYDEVLLCNIGDLGHGLNGFTASGTELEVDTYRQKQTKAIFDSIIGLIEGCRLLVPKVTVYSVEDNHLGHTNEMIMDQVAFWYGGARPVTDVTVVRNSTPVQYVTIGDNLLLVLYHGATGRPGRGDLGKDSGRERNGYYLVQEGIRRYPKHDQVHIITGHVHHRMQEEFAHFTIHTLGTLVKGDAYADMLLLSSKHASQSIFEVNPKTGMIYDIPVPINVR